MGFQPLKVSQTNFSITSRLEEVRYFVRVMGNGAGCSSVSRRFRMHRALGLLSSINKKKIDAFPVAGFHRRDVWTSP